MSSTVVSDFSSIPVISYPTSFEDHEKFIIALQNALISTGFFYLSDAPVPPSTISTLVSYIPKLFALPQTEKDKFAMINSPHFLGYTKLGTEFTKGKVDWREQVDIATPMKSRWNGEEEERWMNVWGPSQVRSFFLGGCYIRRNDAPRKYPDESVLPGFRDAIINYQSEVTKLGNRLIKYISEALGLGPDGLAKFYDVQEKMQHRGKIVSYPVPETGDGERGQGVGPHFDAGFLTILLQASPHPGLQVQNLSGEWIDASPIPGTFVVNFGRALEFATQGIVRATSHRVLSPPATAEWRKIGPRYSVPFFHNIDMCVRMGDKEKWRLEFPEHILRLRDARGKLGNTDSINYGEFLTEPSGKVQLFGRIKSHPDVGERHYPELFNQFFPNGLPK
ncbi:hypothetical protein E1B28_008032 [Marasmius oreades]|uniref:Fe2OG dioxygenase domain-containing protein n=1 Tax=Marasmius oreades TaxID=181124 RepID=A0A9P7S3D4_9AGAR|nr:uncharacterized protein E1B28_008032 [Marasmius oreades]KAG7094433.1 hypothetical protein E1B28_008032 [Marasmius oreades]